MTSPQADTYQQEQHAAVMAAVGVAGTAAVMAGFQLANYTVFLRFLRMIWPTVLRSRRRAAWSARNFFDLERARVTGLPQLDVPLLPDYKFDFFVNDMKPAYQMAVKQIAAVRELEKQGRPAPAPRIESTIRVAVAKNVADAGRDQMVEAVEADAKQAKNLRASRKEAAAARKLKDQGIDLDADYPDVVGWARVATGRETCSWCLMLVSRGPVYRFAENAGAKLTDSEVRALGAAAKIPMDQWHPGCDCTVVPVFDKTNWPGKQAADKALAQWKQASRGITYDPDKKYRVKNPKTGKVDSVTLTEAQARYRETLNNLRFTVEGRDPAARQLARR